MFYLLLFTDDGSCCMIIDQFVYLCFTFAHFQGWRENLF